MGLADDLRRIAAPNPHGVAIAERLLTDPGSPLYSAMSSDEIQRVVRAASWKLYR
jgi:hypothetical protein